MTRLRSLSFPRFGVSKRQEENMSGAASPNEFMSWHSRESSGASSVSSPITPTSSNRSHNRWPSSNSSIATVPDSPVNVAKSALHDLVEDPEERDDALPRLPSESADEPLCICDSTLCEHRRPPNPRESVASHMSEWSAGDDYLVDTDLSGRDWRLRPRSSEIPADNFASRLSRRLPSLSKRWRDQRPTTMVSHSNARSAPPSRTSSVKLPSLRRSLAIHAEPTSSPATPPFTPVDHQAEENVLTRPRAVSRMASMPVPLEIRPPEPAQDPIDRQGLASTPLLPPMMAEHRNYSNEGLQSPLQSPTVANPSVIGSAAGTPTVTPVIPGWLTPPLSSKASTPSFTATRANHSAQSSTEVPPMSISDELDPWAIKLGHANFHIRPEPYYPDICNVHTCNRLLNDWESARREYMRQAVRIGEHYGPTSRTYKLTEQKWAEIDAQWRIYHKSANAEAEAHGETAMFRTLAETQPLAKMPSLNDPQQPSKFPCIDEADIVGPMVQYAKVQRVPTKKTAFLRIFTDPASLLGGRAALGLRR